VCGDVRTVRLCAGCFNARATVASQTVGEALGCQGEARTARKPHRLTELWWNHPYLLGRSPQSPISTYLQLEQCIFDGRCFLLYVFARLQLPAPVTPYLVRVSGSSLRGRVLPSRELETGKLVLEGQGPSMGPQAQPNQVRPEIPSKAGLLHLTPGPAGTTSAPSLLAVAIEAVRRRDIRT
jgi:hypothetical protein